MPTAIMGIILQGLSIVPGLISAFKTIFGKDANTTPAQKTDAITGAAGAVLGVVASASTGGQANTIKKAQEVLPLFHNLTEGIMHLAEQSDASGEQKLAYANEIMTAALQGWEKLSTGGQKTTAEEISPVITTAVNTLVPVLFPKANMTEADPTLGQI